MNIQAYNKAIVALVMAALAVANTVFGIVPPDWMSEANVAAAIALVTPILVYYIPNRPKA